MPTPKIKATYSLDVETVALLERLARRWEMSKSEALRRLIRDGANDPLDDTGRKVAALQRAQRSIALTTAGARAWTAQLREMRRAWSMRRGLDSPPRSGWTARTADEGYRQRERPSVISPGNAERQLRVVNWFTQKMDGGRSYFTAPPPIYTYLRARPTGRHDHSRI